MDPHMRSKLTTSFLTLRSNVFNSFPGRTTHYLPWIYRVIEFYPGVFEPHHLGCIEHPVGIQKHIKPRRYVGRPIEMHCESVLELEVLRLDQLSHCPGNSALASGWDLGGHIQNSIKDLPILLVKKRLFHKTFPNIVSFSCRPGETSSLPVHVPDAKCDI
jgi:hypothetical protein